MTSVRRALKILEVLAIADAAVPLSIIAKQVSLAPSTTHNLLITLVEEDYATNTDGSYRLGPRAAAIASAGEESLQNALNGATDRIAAATGHSAIAVALIADRAKEVAYSPGTDLVTVGRTPVTDLSVLDVATGRLLIAHEDPETWADYVADHDHSTDWDAERWREVLTRFREAGVGLRVPLAGLSPRVSATGVAVPVWRRPGKPSWAVGCSAPWALTAAEVLGVARELWQAGRALTQQLGLADYPVPEPDQATIADVYRAASRP
ncbi:IclR family transcriptional regulator [Microlunatus sp. GCM10028923]|uniref:IclR family transcriptional regulator n=1 Tax=Microlunatus sp. GCM10028923 TaxID=3273400 RepID=UPI0036209A17